MNIISVCPDHGIRVWNEVKNFYTLKSSLEALNQCQLKYYLLEEGNLPNNYDSYEIDGEHLNFFNKEDYYVNQSHKLSWYDMNDEQIEEVYVGQELLNIEVAKTFPNIMDIEKGRSACPSSYPIIPAKIVTVKITKERLRKFDFVKVRCLNE